MRYPSLVKEKHMSVLRLLIIAAVATHGIAYGAAREPGFPNKSVRVIVPFPAGGPADFVARLVGQKLSERWGQSVVVDNRGGAGGNLGTELTAKAPADGHTLLLTTSVFTSNPSLYQKAGYDPFKDFAPVTLTGISATIVSRHPTFPAKTMQDIAQLAKTSAVNYASPGIGTAGHLAAELFGTYAKVKMQQVPYKGAGPAMGALLSGEVGLGFTAVPPVVPHVKAGRLAAIAITSPKRWELMPDVPTVAESGFPGFQVDNMYGVLAPRGTPAAVIRKLNADIVDVLKQPDVKERLATEAFDVIGNTPDEFGKYLKAEFVKWAKVVKESGARVE